MCFENLIGLRTACGSDLIASESGHYINDLPGISVDILNDANDREAESAQELVQRQFDMADRIIKERVREYLGKRYRLKTLLDTTVIGQFEKRDKVQASQAYNVGLKFTITRRPHAQFNITRISLSAAGTTPVTVKLWDLWNGTVLKSVEVTPNNGGIVTEEVNWSVESRGRDLRLFLGYNQTADTFQTPIGSSGCSCTGERWNLRHVLINSRKAPNGADMVEDDLETNSGTSGLSIEASVSCSATHMLCSLKHGLAAAKLFYAGYLLVNQAKYSQRLSPSVLGFKNDYDELSELYLSEYEKALTESVENIRIPKSECYSCTSPTKIQVAV